jgi:hypothetical protein
MSTTVNVVNSAKRWIDAASPEMDVDKWNTAIELVEVYEKHQERLEQLIEMESFGPSGHVSIISCEVKNLQTRLEGLIRQVSDQE